jgi:hypothetical protein
MTENINTFFVLVERVARLCWGGGPAGPDPRRERSTCATYGMLPAEPGGTHADRARFRIGASTRPAEKATIPTLAELKNSRARGVVPRPGK